MLFQTPLLDKAGNEKRPQKGTATIAKDSEKENSKSK